MNYAEATEMIQTVAMIKYPKLVKVEKNLEYAQEVLDSYAGIDGELTAISLYVFQHINLEYKDLSRSLLEVSKIEMHHLDLVGNLLKQLGKEPCYIDSQNKFWNAKDVNYQTKDIVEMLQYNIKAEKDAIVGYQMLIGKTNNESIKALLNRIILDETAHLEIFSGYLEDFFNKND